MWCSWQESSKWGSMVTSLVKGELLSPGWEVSLTSCGGIEGSLDQIQESNGVGDGQTDWGSGCRYADAKPICLREESVELEVLDLPASLRSHSHLWSRALAHDWKNKVANIGNKSRCSLVSKRTSWGGFGIWLGCLTGEVFLACHTGRRPWNEPKTHWRDYGPNPQWMERSSEGQRCAHDPL